MTSLPAHLHLDRPPLLYCPSSAVLFLSNQSHSVGEDQARQTGYQGEGFG